ncbi:hypothetical protein [Phormidium sp. CCY1219]|nr:hypothetical protein [Phormidium sp. CCY1219]
MQQGLGECKSFPIMTEDPVDWMGRSLLWGEQSKIAIAFPLK